MLELDFLEELANDRQAQVKEAVSRANAEDSESRKILILKQALEEIRDGLANVTLAKVQDKITVKNLDEVRAAIRNELNRISKPIISALDKLSISNEKIEQIRSDIELRNGLALESNFDIQILRKPKEHLYIANLEDIHFPESHNVSNLDELEKYFNDLATTVRETFNIDIPTPQVTVEPTPVNIEAPQINLDAPDFKPLLDALKPLSLLSKSAKNPLSVRLSDGKKFIETLRVLADQQEKAAVAYSNGLNGAEMKKLLNAQNRYTAVTSGSKALSSAATAVQVSTSSVKIQYVEVSANGGTIAVGDSSSVATTGSEVGNIIYPGSAPHRINLDNLNKLYAAGASGTRLTYNYYV